MTEPDEPTDTPPSVTTQPASTSVVEGSTAIFTAAASGTPEPTVQWESKTGSGAWTPVADGTSAQLTRAQVTLSQSGTQYRAVFRNSAAPDGVATQAATLTVTRATDPGKQLTRTPTPTISGTGKVGKTLKAKAGTWKPAKVKLSYRWLRDEEPIAKATKSSYKLTKADAGRSITVEVTGSKTGYESVTKTSKAKSIAKVKATLSLSVPKKLVPGLTYSATVTVKGAMANPTGMVTVKAGGATLEVPVTADDKGKVQFDLPAFVKAGKQKVSARFVPNGDTAVSTSASSTVSKTVKPAKVKATVKLSVPGTVAVGTESSATVAVKAAVANPTGRVKVTVNGRTITADLTADDAGTVTLTLPAITRKGTYKVKASFVPTGDTAVSTSSSSTVTKNLKAR